ncbi:hypothetical protein [Permianibacter aggregans]|uniref:Lipoprotein n=1 Tax=Permianibacter aggregans TaxID=1510150 RepID=A0A4R6UKH6_9GAMM|nr:hypothetical protein [Permianibacter aggregans]QGX39783.1 hypothetical protein E2H98_08990 [Permianibacter aggregans]TDQ47092.1 hypothetical protein EV696_11120 [Permianibacter aggregans]
MSNRLLRMTTNALVMLTLTLLCGCATKELKEQKERSLKGNEGYLALVMDSLDSLHTMHINGTSKGLPNIQISHIPIGRTLKMYKVPEGRYCIERFNVYDLQITYSDDGFCFFVEQGELNYPGHFVVRNPVTSLVAKHRDFIQLLRKDYAQLCSQYFAEDCQG